MFNFNTIKQSIYSWFQQGFANLRFYLSAFKKHLFLLSKIGAFALSCFSLYQGVLFMHGLSQWSLAPLLTSALGSISLGGIIFLGGAIVLGVILSATFWFRASIFKSLFSTLQKKENRAQERKDLRAKESTLKSRSGPTLLNHQRQVNDRRLVLRSSSSHVHQKIVKHNTGQSDQVPHHSRGLGYWSKFVVANALGIHGLIGVARFFPPARGLFEYSDLFGVNHLHLTIAAKWYEDASRIIDLVPPETLNRMMRKRWETDYNNTILGAVVSRERIDLFEKILKKLTPEQRFEHLTAVVECGYKKGMVVQQIVNNIGFENETLFWQMTLKYLPAEWQKKLIMQVDQRGDSFLYHLLDIVQTTFALDLFAHLDKEEIKQFLNTPCPHGATPLMRFCVAIKDKGVKKLSQILPYEDWQEVFSYKSSAWSMTHGEKIMVVSTALAMSQTPSVGGLREVGEDWCLSKVFGDDLPDYLQDFDERSEKEYIEKCDYSYDAGKEASTYLAKTFGLKLPDYLREYDRRALIKELKETRDYNRMANCNSNENFKSQHGLMLHEVLGVTDPWPMYTELNKHYRSSMRKVHPDKHPNASADKKNEMEERSILLNKAHEFVCDENARLPYSSLKRQ